MYESTHGAWLIVVALWFLATGSSSPSPNKACPGSPASVHAKCDMTIKFPSTCDVVRAEITSRILGEGGWVDPHNAGTYALLEEEDDGSFLRGSRVTGDGKYTDLFGMSFVETNQPDGGGCVVEACSESQVTSVLDFSTNYCNLRSLYCNKSGDGCPIVTEELVYAEEYNQCWQRKAPNCVSSQKEDQL